MKRAAKHIHKKLNAIVEGTLQQVDAEAYEDELRTLIADVSGALSGAEMPSEPALCAEITHDDALVRVLCAVQALSLIHI